jgi:hypothetical protein
MSPELEKQLLEHPSKFYKDLYYFECGDGWGDILRTLADNIFARQNNSRMKKLVHATQVKEKYGRLVVYFSPHDDDIDALVKEAQESSWSTCEHCGKLAELRRVGEYLTTLCDDHHNDWLARLRKT